jgi:hypothetical protein
MQYGALNDAGMSMTTLRTLIASNQQSLVTLWIRNEGNFPQQAGIGMRVDGNSYGVYSNGVFLGVGGFTPNVIPTVGPVPGPGVLGTGPTQGVRGVARGEPGVLVPPGSAGVVGRGVGLGSNGVIGEAANDAANAVGVLGIAGPERGSWAGLFDGPVAVVGFLNVTGPIIKGGGGFRIDHPLDPENRYLSHSFVESPDALNVYRGNVSTDEAGNAVVTLPDYFGALNEEFCYQLTVLGEMARAVVAEEITDNQFKIRTDRPNVKVSWQVTGIRKDAFADLYRTTVDVEKPAGERGTYLHPEAFGQPESRRVTFGREGGQMIKESLRAQEAELLASLPVEPPE